MRPIGRSLLLYATFMALALLAVWVGPCRMASVPASSPLDDWDIPQLAAYLNQAGVKVQPVSTQKDGVVSSSVFLMAITKEWSELNGLSKHSERIQEWQGIVFCTHETPASAANLAQQWGDRCLRIGLFLFYGDADLRARIDATLKQAAQVESPWGRR